MSNMLGLPCLLLVVRRAVAARHLQYRQASAKRPQGRRPGGGARRAGYWTKLRRTVTTLGSARSKPAPACSERPVRSDPGAPGGKPWTRVKPASIVSPRNRQRCSRRPCGSPRSTFRRIRPHSPAGARRTRPADRRQPGRPRLGQRARPGVTAANERTGLLRGRRLPLQPRSALLPLVLQRRQGSRCRWRWWPWNWRGGWTFRWSE